MSPPPYVSLGEVTLLRSSSGKDHQNPRSYLRGQGYAPVWAGIGPTYTWWPHGGGALAELVTTVVKEA